MNDEFQRIIEEQVEVEKIIVEIANESVKSLKNVLIRELIKGIALDSKKHSMICEALLTSEEKLATPLIDESESKMIRETIERHIQLEARAISAYQKALKSAEHSSSAKLVLEYLVQDERRHHALLLKLHELLVRPSTLKESDVWDMLWQYSLSHGSPGG